MEKDRNKIDVEDIASKCLDSEGYLLFAAYLTPRKDKDGRTMIDFQYRRYHFSLEDSRQALKSLKAFIQAELDQLVLKQGENEDA